MRSHELNLEKYNTDKINNRYLDWYDPIVDSLVTEKIALLELGVHKGGSLLLWRDYFPKALIVGVDIQPQFDFSREERIRVFQGAQQDTAFLTEVANQTAPEGFDIIIDDASHFGALTRTSFWRLFDNHLKPSGIYAIEDWGTGYWEDWPDGKAYRPASRFYHRLLVLLKRLGIISRVPFHNHNYGMVGFIKELVDEQGASALTKGSIDTPAIRGSKFASMTITPSIVFIKKRPAGT
ncbi:MAG TPA: class I SAM-dependent methyltransferase [Blastocatellia bacterium]|nr:class I SAM-dependent methyltransferase [Blastocatellia bacterium]